MFARSIAFRLKPNCLAEFTRTFVGNPEALKSLGKVLDGRHRVWVSDVIISMIRHTATVAAAYL
jgi:hypothetical protein